MNWTVSRRIFAAFGTALTLLLITAAVGAYALARSERAYSAALSQQQGVLVPALEARSAFQDANLSFLFFLLHPEERWRGRADSSLSAAQAIVARLSTDATQTAARDSWRTAGSLLRQIDAPMEAAMTAALAGGLAEAISIRDSRVVPLRNELHQTLSEGMLLANQRTAEIVKSAQTTANRLAWVLLAGSLIALALGIVVAMLLNRAVTIPLQRTASVLASSAAEILAATTQQASGASQTAASIAETVTSVDEVAQTAEHAAERARAVADLAKRAAEISRAGRTAADHSVAEMEQVKGQVESISRHILGLAEQAQAIGTITATVTDIAEQTNLLALNAAVEAARAGEQGRGFAVLATEIRGLADESKKATVQVREILGEIQRATTAAVVSTERGTTQVSSGARQVAEAGETIRELAEAITEASQAAAQIVASASQQAAGMAQIRQAMSNVQEATQQNLAATRQAEHAAQDLNAMGSSLLRMVSGRAQNLARTPVP